MGEQILHESDYVSSAHSPVQWHSNVSKPWAVDMYSTVTTQELNKEQIYGTRTYTYLSPWTDFTLYYHGSHSGIHSLRTEMVVLAEVLVMSVGSSLTHWMMPLSSAVRLCKVSLLVTRDNAPLSSKISTLP